MPIAGVIQRFMQRIRCDGPRGRVGVAPHEEFLRRRLFLRRLLASGAHFSSGRAGQLFSTDPTPAPIRVRQAGMLALMTNSLSYDLQEHGYLIRSARLRQLGHSRTALDVAKRDGLLLRPVRPWVATRAASREAVIAVAHRGILTSSSALRSYGIWSGTDVRIHVLLHPHTDPTPARLVSALADFRPTNVHSVGVNRHWGEPSFALASGPEWRASILDALADFATANNPHYAVAAIDNAIYLEKLRPSDLPLLLGHLPARLHHIAALIDGRAESGTETLARCRISEMGCRFEIQVKIGGHRVDILIDGWLIVEIDSEEWHGKDRLTDSRRTNWLFGIGYRVLHFDYHEVMHEWPSCERVIREQLRIPPRSS